MHTLSYKLGCWKALVQCKLSAAGGQPSSSPTPQAGQGAPSIGRSSSTMGRNSSTPSKAPSWGLGGSTPAGFQSQPAPGSGPFPTSQTGAGSIPAAPTLQPGVTGNNTPASATSMGAAVRTPSQQSLGIPGANPFK